MPLASVRESGSGSIATASVRPTQPGAKIAISTIISENAKPSTSPGTTPARNIRPTDSSASTP